MALENKSDNLIYLNVKYIDGDKDTGTPRFCVLEKKDNNWVIKSSYSDITGIVTGIEKREFEYRGKIQKQYKVKITDGEEDYSLELNYNYYSLSVLNSLANETDLSMKRVRFGIYRNKDGFVNIIVNVDGEKTDWKYKKLPSPGSDKWDKTFDHLIELINSITEDIKVESKPISNFADEEYEGITPSSQAPDTDEASDLPF